MSLDSTVFQILKAIDVAYENNNFNLEETLNLEKLKISERRRELLLDELKNNGYITGISVVRAVGGYSAISINNPRLTLTGMDFLENNSAMKKAYEFLKEAKGWIPGL